MIERCLCGTRLLAEDHPQLMWGGVMWLIMCPSAPSNGIVLFNSDTFLESGEPPVSPWLNDRSAADDTQGAVIHELVALAKAENREDFDFLAGASGVEDRDTLWSGTRARLGKAETM